MSDAGRVNLASNAAKIPDGNGAARAVRRFAAGPGLALD